MKTFKQRIAFYWKHREGIVALAIIISLCLLAMIVMDIVINQITQ